MVQRGWYFVGFGFSYQGRDTKTNQLLCDFKFKSGTFNNGNLFTNSPLKVEHIDTRRLQDKLGNFLKLAFNYSRSHKNRVTEVSTLLFYRDFYGKAMKSYLPACPK